MRCEVNFGEPAPLAAVSTRTSFLAGPVHPHLPAQARATHTAHMHDAQILGKLCRQEMLYNKEPLTPVKPPLEHDVL